MVRSEDEDDSLPGVFHLMRIDDSLSLDDDKLLLEDVKLLFEDVGLTLVDGNRPLPSDVVRPVLQHEGAPAQDVKPS